MASELTPPRSSRAVFRAQAVEQYVRTREEVILPRFVSRRAILLLWGALAAITLAAAALLMIRLPVYTSGPVASAGPGLLAVSIPERARVRPGQAAFLSGADGPRRFAGRVIATRGGENGVAFVRLAPGAPACAPPSCRVDIRIGSPRALEFFALGELGPGQ